MTLSDIVKGLETTTTSSQVSLSELCGCENSTSVESEKKYPPLQSTKIDAQFSVTKNSNPLDGVTMDDVVVSEKATNIISQNRKSQGMRLESIKRVCLTKIGVQSLRLFCTQVGLNCMRKKSKFEICNTIAESKISGSYVELH